MRAGIIGCGVISDIYLKNLTGKYTNPVFTACADIRPEAAQKRAMEYGIRAMSVEEMLSDPQIDLILNLTTPLNHTQISLQALEHNKHVFSEKPLAVTLEDGKQILDLAREKGLQVGCSPDTFLGAGLQTAFKALRNGWIGEPVAAAAFWSSRGHERWHGNPGFYYTAGGGPHYDMGPYYITALINALGRVRRVNAISRRTFPQRLVTAEGPMHGARIPVEVETHLSASLEFDSGVIATVLMSFDLWSTNLPRLEFYGTAGTLCAPDPNFFDGPVKIRTQYDDAFREIPLVNPFTGNARGLGLAQMCRAIENGGSILSCGEQALHVLEVIEAIDKAGRTGKCVFCETPYDPSELLPTGLQEPLYGF